MFNNFMDLVRHIRANVLEKGYNELVIDIDDSYVSFGLYECEQVHIAYYPFESDIKPKIIITGLPHFELEDITELDEIHAIAHLIIDNREMIDKELFDEEADA